MSAATAIGKVSESLKRLLEGEMSPRVDVTLLAPDETSNARQRVNLFLYRVQEHPQLRNQDWRRSRDNPSQLVPPPLTLCLFYLVTVFVASEQQNGGAIAHNILGDVMRVLYEHPLVPQTYLAGELVDAHEQVTVLHQNVELESLLRIWSACNQPYRPSLSYEVSVVQIDMHQRHRRNAAPPVRRIGVPNVQAPFRPPEVQTITPQNGPGGTIVQVVGQALAGWPATVRFAGTVIQALSELPENWFSVQIPPDLAPGVYDLRIDIGSLFRRTFLFEVTA